MPVYVDKPRHPYGRMVMCHMMADTTDELLKMADEIGVARRWLQKRGHALEHFDICKTKRLLAVQAGAVEVESMREIIRARREAQTGLRIELVQQEVSGDG